VFAEYEQRAVAHPFEAQSADEPMPPSVARHRRRGENRRGGLVFTGEGRLRSGGVYRGVSDSGRVGRRRPNNNVHRCVEPSYRHDNQLGNQHNTEPDTGLHLSRRVTRRYLRFHYDRHSLANPHRSATLPTCQ